MTVPITPCGYAHVRLTVTDIVHSRAFYDNVFGLPVDFELPPDADDATRAALGFLYGGVIYKLGDGLFGLRPVAPANDCFDEDRVGLDHVSFTLGSRAEIEGAAARLDDLGITHCGVKDLGASLILEFRDPDNISLELFAQQADGNPDERLTPARHSRAPHPLHRGPPKPALETARMAAQRFAALPTPVDEHLFLVHRRPRPSARPPALSTST